jgi:hypothetical protein
VSVGRQFAPHVLHEPGRAERRQRVERAGHVGDRRPRAARLPGDEPPQAVDRQAAEDLGNRLQREQRERRTLLLACDEPVQRALIDSFPRGMMTIPGWGRPSCRSRLLESVQVVVDGTPTKTTKRSRLSSATTIRAWARTNALACTHSLDVDLGVCVRRSVWGWQLRVKAVPGFVIVNELTDIETVVTE